MRQSSNIIKYQFQKRGRYLTVSDHLTNVFRLSSEEGGPCETDISAEQSQEGQAAWLPKKNVDSRRSLGYKKKTRKGPQAPFCLTWAAGGLMANVRSLTRKLDFKRVYEGGVKRVGRFLVVYLYEADDDAQAFVASRKLGGAVKRNRAKRLLRAAISGSKPKTAG